ncbi:hypothetical protein N7E81_08325 [Reichenbachiella carrageenanivorans]|uniref:Uncharacterized protein n=1 Tax=Reichenbachiella carrageenanivorans TaxID=2979869 RepID=A0ABY6D669_9BACT|nr:hypothetical protein [Reichenbachiella carrageenanivorans]UXX81105.1 hypothetical protein N7E81_08325 [Reichenbachiella carrageenanivorans]
MNHPIPILVFIYNSYKDPLFQNLLLQYIKTLSQNGNYRFDLITFEQPQYALSIEETKLETNELEKYNIYWHPRKFHTGRFLLFKKAFDVISTFFQIIRIKATYKTRYIFAFANVAAAIAVLFSRFMNLKLVIYSYEPHSDFMVELKLWSKQSWNYRILHWLEKMAAQHASDIMTGTIHMVEKLKSEGIKANLYRAPTAVDPDTFYFRPESRDQLHQSLGIDDQHVYIYPGKFGGLYYEREIIALFGQLYAQDPKSYFLVATDYDKNQIHSWFEEENIPTTSYHLRAFIDAAQIPDYLSAADMGIVAIPPTPSQKFRSPTKVAEYLLCGLPYITCQGVSEDDEYATDHEVGIVVNDFSREEISKVYPKIDQILALNKSELREKCRKVGLDYRSRERVDHLLQSIFK